MQERLRLLRTRTGYRLWLAPSHERRALLVDLGRDRLRSACSGLCVGDTVVARRELSDRLSEARVAEVVYSDRQCAGPRDLVVRPADLGARHDRRVAIHTADNIDQRAGIGARRRVGLERDPRLEPLVPLQRDIWVHAELPFADVVVDQRRARMVRSAAAGDESGIHCIDVASVTP